MQEKQCFSGILIFHEHEYEIDYFAVMMLNILCYTDRNHDVSLSFTIVCKMTPI